MLQIRAKMLDKICARNELLGTRSLKSLEMKKCTKVGEVRLGVVEKNVLQSLGVLRKSRITREQDVMVNRTIFKVKNSLMDKALKLLTFPSSSLFSPFFLQRMIQRRLRIEKLDYF